MVPTVDEAFCVEERNPTMFCIHADLFDDKALTSIKDGLTWFNVLCLLKHGFISRTSVSVFKSRDFGDLAKWGLDQLIS
jgi:hypothetical protein